MTDGGRWMWCGTANEAWVNEETGYGSRRWDNCRGVEEVGMSTVTLSLVSVGERKLLRKNGNGPRILRFFACFACDGEKLLLAEEARSRQNFCTVTESAVVRRFLCASYADLHKFYPNYSRLPWIFRLTTVTKGSNNIREGILYLF
jgi:hypothetical protein